MNLIKSSVTNITPQRYLEEDILKHIELCGRTCYKSEDKITDTSAEKFVNMLKKNKHRSVLEHGTVYLKFDFDLHYITKSITEVSSILIKYRANPYSKGYFDGINHVYYITTNYRVIIENGWEEDLQYMIDIPNEHQEKRYTFKITCSRAIANEVVRHRKMSFSQESTRYCNYSNEKFGKELTFIIPEKLNMLPEGLCYFHDGINFRIQPDINDPLNTISINPRKFKNAGEIDLWLTELDRISYTYFDLINKYQWKPEEARGILPLDLKTDLIVTGTKDQWDDFFELRCAKSAHPDIQVIANEIKNQID